jgi:hypothetical protein
MHEIGSSVACSRRSQVVLVDPPRLVAPATERLAGTEDEVVVLEQERGLDAAVAAREGVPICFVEEERVHTGPSILRHDAEEHQAHARDVAAHRHEPSRSDEVTVAEETPPGTERPVRVGERAEDGDQLVVDARETDEPGVDDWLQGVGDADGFPLRDRYVAPVVRPRLVVDLDHPDDLVAQVLEPSDPRLDVAAPADHPGDRRDTFEGNDVQVEEVRVVVLDLAQPPLLQELTVERRVVRAFDGRRRVEAVDKDSLTLVGRVGVFAGSAHRQHASGRDPLLRRVEQHRGGFVVPGDVEEAEEPDPHPVVLVELMVDRRRDAADSPATPPHDEMGDLGVPVVGVLGGEQAGGAEELAAEQVGGERRGPEGVASEEPPREHGELPNARVAEAELLDGECSHGRALLCIHADVMDCSPLHW